MNRQKGFNLIELIVIATLLVTLSAAAIPSFMNVTSSARIASLNGLMGALNTGVATVRGSWNAQNRPANTITLDIGSVNVTASGYPEASAAGIGTAVNTTGYTASYPPATAAGVATFTMATDCFVTYHGTTGVSSTTTSGC